jgi:hypothetical protein
MSMQIIARTLAVFIFGFFSACSTDEPSPEPLSCLVEQQGERLQIIVAAGGDYHWIVEYLGNSKPAIKRVPAPFKYSDTQNKAVVGPWRLDDIPRAQPAGRSLVLPYALAPKTNTLVSASVPEGKEVIIAPRDIALATQPKLGNSTIVYLGGQGIVSALAWSPDEEHFATVVQELRPAENENALEKLAAMSGHPIQRYRTTLVIFSKRGAQECSAQIAPGMISSIGGLSWDK